MASGYEEDGGLLFDVGALFGQKKVNHGDPKHDYVYTIPVMSKFRKSDNSRIVDCIKREDNTLLLHLPDSSVTLMAQYVWQSSITLADLLFLHEIVVNGKSVIELGAGSALPSLAAIRCEAERVIITDYPEIKIMENIKHNLRENYKMDCLNSWVTVCGHKWGEVVESLIEANKKQRFDVILMADTLWLQNEHSALAKSCSALVKDNTSIVVCTFMHHDDAEKVANDFFSLITESYGFKIVKEKTVDWYDRKLENDKVDPEEYGPVYLKILQKS